MSVLCDKFNIYFDTPGLSGTSLIGKTVYSSDTGGTLATGDGYYSDGDYIYYIQNNVVQSAYVPGYYSCGGAPTPVPTPTQTPIPWICVQLKVHVGDVDLIASDTGEVFFDFYDCSENPQTISYVTHGLKNTGYCLYTKYDYSAYIYVGGNRQDATASYIDDPFTANVCVP